MMADLFKESIRKTKNIYLERATVLSKAIDSGENELKDLLFVGESPRQYWGKYEVGRHNKCKGFETNTFREKRLCKCMYYRNSQYAKQAPCSICAYSDGYKVTSEYKITDYEVPGYYHGDGIGEIDLIISDGITSYATEIKPFKGNRETILRMIAEILTYTIGYPQDKYKKAIGFFEGSPQYFEYNNIYPEIKDLLVKADISVFMFKEIQDKEYEICKL